jgi:hypothetical protein
MKFRLPADGSDIREDGFLFVPGFLPPSAQTNRAALMTNPAVQARQKP